MQKSSDLNPEIKKQVQTAFIFDVDGVITDPKEKRITNHKIVDLIIKLINKGNFVAFNSGRDTNWVKNSVLNSISVGLKNKSLLKDVIAIGEKGTSIMRFDGGWIEEIDKKYSLPNELKKELKDFVLTTKSMFYDENKHNMATLEMKDGYDIDSFVKERDSILPKVKQIVGEFNDIIAEPTSIDIDIQHKDSGKHLGAKHILAFIDSKSLNPISFITIGDSESDLEMADELYTQGKNVEFWYVNPSKPIGVEKPYPIRVSEKEFTEGTLELLKELSSN